MGDITDDPRAARAREIAQELAELASRSQALADERRALLGALRAAGGTMEGIARAVGVNRQRLYQILGPIDPSDQRKRGPAPKQ